MTVFWISAIALCLLTLWMLWRPLKANSALKMESIQSRNIAIAKERALEIDSAFEAGDLSADDRDQAMQDLELALADELADSTELKDQFSQTPRASTLLILALIPVLAFSLYSYTSNYNPDATTAHAQAKNGEAPSFEELITRIEEAVKANPEDQQGLYLLAQSYAQFGRYEESAVRFKQLLALTGPNPDVLVGYVDARAMANNQTFDRELADMLSQAIELDPQHISALWLSGLAEQQLGDSEKALRRWLVLRPLLADNAEASKELEVLISGARAELGPRADKVIAAFEKLNPTTTAAANGTASSGTATNETASLTVTVSLSPELQAEVSASDSVFIFAKAKTGPPMPLAASRQTASALPITVTLDDSMAMLPQMKLSSFPEVVVGARISKSGQAISQPGDLESELTVSSNSNPDTIEVVISRRRK